MTIYKIRNKAGFFSKGRITTGYNGKPTVQFSKQGKEWTTEKAVKDHLIKWISEAGVPDWELVTVTYEPTPPIQDWFDDKMLASLLKRKYS